ncbi:MAG: GAF domain-containing protein [Candidatus Tectomicrobia bacterium]|uniref:histidine kinase n=1 Tax=Tectimicrobiota bacterium TaxID=2528274 RepID=A0A932CQB7_UNCTE|nr:GAF domain-containing protein [Candidatus Tectomicrobia bacterium]
MTDLATALTHLEQTQGKLEALSEAVHLLTGTLDLREVLQRLTELVRARLRADVVRIWLQEDVTGELHLQAQAGTTQQPGEYRMQLQPGEGLVGWILAHRAPLALPDHWDDPRARLINREWAKKEGLNSFLGVPLLLEDAPVGALVIFAREFRVFSPEEVALAELLAAPAAIAIRNARLYGEQVRCTAEAQGLIEIARAIGSTLELKPLLQQITQQAARTCEMDRCSIYLWEEERVVPVMSQYADGRMDRARWKAFKERGRMRCDEVPFFAETVQRREPVLIEHPASDPRVPPEMEIARSSALLLLPLIRQERVVGALLLDNLLPDRPVTPTQIALATTIASQVALAIDNARLYQEARTRARELEERNRQLQLIHEAARAITAEHELDRLLQRIVETAQQLLGARYGAIAVSQDGEIRQLFTVGMSSEMHERIGALPTGQGLTRYLLHQGQTLRVGDLTAHPAAAGFPPGHPPMQSLLGGPIRLRGKILGALYLTEKPGGFTADDETLMTTLCSDAAVAIDNAHLLAEEQQRRREADTLLEIAQATGSTLNPQALFQIIAREAARACRVDRCSIFLWDESEQWVIPVMSQFADGTTDPPMWESFKALGKMRMETVPFFQEVIRQREPVLIFDPAADPLIPPDWVAPFQLASVLAVPLIHGDRPIGALILDYLRESRPFTPDQIRLATTLASQVALAMENARLVKSLQQALDDLKAAQTQLVRMETLRAMGELASGMAHHMNNLLAVILTWTQLLLRKVQSPEIRRPLEIVERTALDGAEVVRRVRGFTRMQPISEAIQVDLNLLAREVVELTRPRWQDQAHLQGIQIEVSLALEPIPAVLGEPAPLREILMNLLLNAIDALPQGGKITLQTGYVDPWVYCSVADNGVGMPEEVQRRALEPFFTTKGPKSTGLGLSVNYGIIQRHGGELHLESTPGKGTTVTVRLPVAPTIRAAQADILLLSTSPVRILFIEDEPEVREALAELLATQGHTVIQAASGQEGLARLEKGEPIDLVLTDLGMPGMTGWEVARAVKTRWPYLPVGLITGWEEELEAPSEGRTEASLLKEIRILKKPITPENLFEAIAQLCSPARPN